MAAAGPVDRQAEQALVAKTKTLINTQLKAILRAEGSQVSGAKATLQDRIIRLIHQYVQTGDHVAFDRLRGNINGGSASSSYYNHSTGHTPSLHNYSNTPAPARPSNPYPPNMQSPYAQVRPNFKESPFYTIIDSVTPVLECKVRESTRDQLDCKINLRIDTVDRLNRDPLLRVMIYCASEPVSQFSKVDITFPHQVEIRVNLDEVKSNLRGLKNKPGSTRPADITNLLRKRAGYDNTMTVTYALTNKRFYIVVNLVKQHPPEELVDKLKAGKIISKEQVIREMVTKAQDNDIVTTSSILSLKCPLSTVRMSVPCRSTVCTHNQCFDAFSFLQLQEQAPTWTCPICNKIISFEALEVDQYVDNILRSTSRPIDQVTVEPNGTWSQISQIENLSQRHGTRSDSDEDDEVIEIQDMPRLAAVKDEALPNPASMVRTPPYSSREQSTASAAPRSGHMKRPVSQVIDLTFSSDEEEQPFRGPKRQLIQAPSNGGSYTYSSPGLGGADSLARSDRLRFRLPQPTPVEPRSSSGYSYGS